MKAQFLLVKRGLYYRPHGQGYTGRKSDAGRFFETEARPADGVTAVHEDEAPAYSDGCWPETMLADANSRIAEDEILLRSAVRNARSRYSRGYRPRWVAVMDTFAVGSTMAHELCTRFGFDPDERVRR
jgi:hypothetical protein